MGKKAEKMSLSLLLLIYEFSKRDPLQKNIRQAQFSCIIADLPYFANYRKSCTMFYDSSVEMYCYWDQKRPCSVFLKRSISNSKYKIC